MFNKSSFVKINFKYICESSFSFYPTENTHDQITKCYRNGLQNPSFCIQSVSVNTYPPVMTLQRPSAAVEVCYDSVFSSEVVSG